jgi:hypothetical protein
MALSKNTPVRHLPRQKRIKWAPTAHIVLAQLWYEIFHITEYAHKFLNYKEIKNFLKPTRPKACPNVPYQNDLAGKG